MKVFSLSEGSVRVCGSVTGLIPRYALVDREKLEIIVFQGEGELKARVLGRSCSISVENISAFLQSSYSIPPATIYRDIYVANIGDVLEFSWKDGDIHVDYQHSFPFSSALREKKEIDSSAFLEDLHCASERQIQKGEVYLFHTAGKDSNAILASYLEAGEADKLVLLSGQSKGITDESQISKAIAKKFGIRHITVPMEEKLDEARLLYLKNLLSRQPLPNVDSVMLPLCLYGYDQINFNGANCIFGDGNDGYFLSVPSKLESRLSNITTFLSFFRRFAIPISSGSKLFSLFRSGMEWSGVYGLTYFDLKKILKGAVNVYPAVLEDECFRGVGGIEFKSDAYATRAISQRMIQKLSLFCLSNNANCVLPFADEEFVSNWGYLSLEQVVDKEQGMNKVFLRNIVRDVVGLDTTKIGKKGWAFDYVGFVNNHEDLIIREIKAAGCWSKGVLPWVKSMMTVKNTLCYSSVQACRSVYVVFMFSMWVSSRGMSLDNGGFN